MKKMTIEEHYMKEAIRQAKKAAALKEVPIGCVIVHDGKIIARGYNRRTVDKNVLELATGTGLIAKHIVNAAAHIEATDASAEMIAEAKRDNHSAKLHFSVQDMLRLPYADKSFSMPAVS